VEIRPVSELADVMAAAHLFASAPQPEATGRFLAADHHHLLIAYFDGAAAGMVAGVELTHPATGTEMFVAELAVDPTFQSHGVGAALVTGLGEVAQQRGCSAMWVVTDGEAAAALATYRAGSASEPGQVVVTWPIDPPSVPWSQSAPGR
jgi:ribosomal protein S18 acetylase RimI-like enzyme